MPTLAEIFSSCSATWKARRKVDAATVVTHGAGWSSVLSPGPELPAEFATRNVFVEVVAAGKRQALPYYANAMDVKITDAYGQVKVTGPDGKPERDAANEWLRATYRGKYLDVTVTGSHSDGDLAVVGVQPLVEIRHADRHVGGDAEHRLRLRRPDETVIDDIDVPEADLGIFNGQAQPLLALAQAGLRPDAFDMRPAPLDHLPHQGDLARRPIAHPVLVDRHHRRQPAVLDQRTADDGLHADRLVQERLARGDVLADRRPAARLISVYAGALLQRHLGHG